MRGRRESASAIGDPGPRRHSARDLLSVGLVVAAVAAIIAAVVGPATTNLSPVLQPARPPIDVTFPDGTDGPVAVEIRPGLRAVPRQAAAAVPVAAPRRFDVSSVAAGFSLETRTRPGRAAPAVAGVLPVATASVTPAAPALDVPAPALTPLIEVVVDDITDAVDGVVTAASTTDVVQATSTRARSHPTGARQRESQRSVSRAADRVRSRARVEAPRERADGRHERDDRDGRDARDPSKRGSGGSSKNGRSD